MERKKTERRSRQWPVRTSASPSRRLVSSNKSKGQEERVSGWGEDRNRETKEGGQTIVGSGQMKGRLCDTER